MTKPCVQCGKEFEYKTHNQKYCSKDCCRLFTNKKIMDKYYAKKARLAGEIRLCANCNSRLSRYNPDSICEICQELKRKNKANIARREIFNVISKISEDQSK